MSRLLNPTSPLTHHVRCLVRRTWGNVISLAYRTVIELAEQLAMADAAGDREAEREAIAGLKEMGRLASLRMDRFRVTEEEAEELLALQESA